MSLIVVLSFTTWITIALTAGVPMELVRRVTGHATVDVVLKHYFRPGRTDFRKALQKAMPKLLTSGTEKAPDETQRKRLSLSEVRAMLEGMNGKNWEKIKTEIVSRIPEG